MAEKYVAPKAEVVKFDSMDIICTSGCGHPEYRERLGIEDSSY